MCCDWALIQTDLTAMANRIFSHTRDRLAFAGYFQVGEYLDSSSKRRSSSASGIVRKNILSPSDMLQKELLNAEIADVVQGGNGERTISRGEEWLFRPHYAAYSYNELNITNIMSLQLVGLAFDALRTFVILAFI
jgi:hypothetical protein